MISALQCPNLTPLTNGTISPVGPHYHTDVVTFDCNPGYELDGAFTATCGANLTWSHPVPTCRDENECIDGSHTCDLNAICTNTPGNFACTCKPGYSGDGLTCTDDNECADGNHNCSPQASCKNTPGSFNCSCNSGYSGDGVTCADNNECTDGTHDCSPDASCTNTPGSFLCTCNTGYSGNGVTCTDNDECTAGSHNCSPNTACTNTPGSFICTALQCPTLTAPADGTLNSTGPYDPQNVVLFTCNQGYELDGSSTVTCQANLTWSGAVPSCLALQCPTLAAPANGTLSPAGPHYYQNVATFTCNLGYELHGAVNAKCQVDNNNNNTIWSDPVPTCIALQCSSVTAPTNGTLSHVGPYYYLDVVTFTCNLGYELDGTPNATCQAHSNNNLAWSDQVPTCKSLQCPTLTVPPDGTMTPAGPHHYQDLVTFTCNLGYEIHGAVNSTCHVDNNNNPMWSDPVPTCTALECPTLTAPANGILSPVGPHYHQDVATFTCNLGYALDGAPNATCKADRNNNMTWSDKVSTCRALQCSNLTAPANGTLSSTGPHYHQDFVTFGCYQGYRLDGASNAKCQANSNNNLTWSDPVPTCTALQCSNLMAPDNGTRNLAGPYYYQDVVAFTCNLGYALDGASNATCKAGNNNINLTWSDPVPTCTALQCPNVTAPANGALRPVGPHYYKDVVTFTCNQWYELEGAPNATCQAFSNNNLTWSDPVPTCRGT
ncbi:P-selectin-like [Branchiostoma lanceolatum]|uniref:P-selectin-like n=1 Tax=Branchiostoma lanceolatum TaxID=7740 RepID=UPI00345438E0